MKKRHTKITKLFTKIDALTADALRAAKPKQRDKKWTSAEKLCRKALELSREGVAQSADDNGYSLLISSVYRLSALLMRQGRDADAEPLLAEVYSMEQFASHRYGIACRAYYGSLLCENGSYNAAGRVLAEMLRAVEQDSAGLATMADLYALCMGCGHAAMAFTYADDDGYDGRLFEAPVARLMKLREDGFEVDSENMIRASYFAASEALYQTCFDAVSTTDVGKAVYLARYCVDECRRAGVKGLFEPAAMRLAALAAARDCQFADAAKLCKETLELCSSYSCEMSVSCFGSIQNIAADMNLLLGIMHYRASHYEKCISYFRAGVAALEADAQGRPLKQLGYQEVENIAMRMTSAEKAAFAYRYWGLAMFVSENEETKSDRYSVSQCAATVRRSAELLESFRDSEPYLCLLASDDYHVIAQMYTKRGDAQQAAQYEELSKSCGMDALANLSIAASLYETRMENLRARKRTALRLGLLELYGDDTRFERMLSEKPYVEEEDEANLAYLSFYMGDYCRVMSRYESALEYYDAVMTHTFDKEGNAYYDVSRLDFWEPAAVARAACLVRMEQMPQARRAYREYVNSVRERNGSSSDRQQLVRNASVSREIGLNPAECAEYFHTAANAFGDQGEELKAAELYNQEGICWYNASPDTDLPDDVSLHSQDPTALAASLSERFSARELEAFENAYHKLRACDQKDAKVMDLLPSLLSNIGECHVRVGKYDIGLPYYLNAVGAFEALFASKEFGAKDSSEQMTYVFQYGSCFKTLGEIYDAKDDNKSAAEAFTKAIEVFERLHSDSARHELAYCLNARGCIRYRLDDYRGEVDDITRALDLKKDDEDSEIVMAIMLKNRSDAYRELGNYKSMHSDLAKSIDMLDHSGMPDDILNGFYGSHWFSMGVCQEGLHKIGQAADAYRKAAKYMSSSSGSGEEPNVFMQALCHFRRAVCLCRRDEQEFYGALGEYNNAIDLLENLPASGEKNENLKQVLSSRANLYEVFREIDLAKADYSRAEKLGHAGTDA